MQTLEIHLREDIEIEKASLPLKRWKDSQSLER